MVCDRVLKPRFNLQDVAATIICIYASHTGISNELKDHVYDILLQATLETYENDLIFVARGFNRHISLQPVIFERIHMFIELVQERRRVLGS